MCKSNQRNLTKVNPVFLQSISLYTLPPPPLNLSLWASDERVVLCACTLCGLTLRPVQMASEGVAGKQYYRSVKKTCGYKISPPVPVAHAGALWNTLLAVLWWPGFTLHLMHFLHSRLLYLFTFWYWRYGSSSLSKNLSNAVLLSSPYCEFNWLLMRGIAQLFTWYTS